MADNILINLLAYRPSGTGLNRYADLVLKGWGMASAKQLRLMTNGRATIDGTSGHLHRAPRLLQAADLLQDVNPIKALVEQSNCDLIYAPFTQTLRTIKTIPQVITCHDLTPLHYPNSRRAALYVRLVSLVHLKHADHIVAISTSVADTLMETGIESKRISIVYNGIEIAPKPIKSPSSRNILIIARHARNKNIELALQGFARFLKFQPEWDGKLIVIGQHDRRTKAIHQLKDELNLRTRVTMIERVTDTELDQHYRKAFCLISTSLMEGFDYPLLEAQTRGLPTLASEIAVHRELHRDSSLLFNYSDQGLTLSKELNRLVTEQHTWQQLSERGIEHAKEFTLERQVMGIQSLLAQMNSSN